MYSDSQVESVKYWLPFRNPVDEGTVKSQCVGDESHKLAKLGAL